MTCYFPYEGYRAKNPNENGKYPIVFDKNSAQLDSPLAVPCGRCIGCRDDTAIGWATRSHHEMMYHEESCFLTLTYDDDHIPENASLSVADWENFIQRLRRHFAPSSLKFLGAAEYGKNFDHLSILGQSQLGRPHYHLILFGHDFKDREQDGYSKSEEPIYLSETLTRIWGKGRCTVQDANRNTAQYVAGYILKKVNGELAENHYTRTYFHTGECVNILPEFSRKSRNIGRQWYDEFKDDLRKGFITINGSPFPCPKAYLKWMADEPDETIFLDFKEQQRIKNNPDHPDLHGSRLSVRSQCHTVRKNKNERGN